MVFGKRFLSKRFIYSLLVLSSLFHLGCLKQESNQLGLGEWKAVFLDSQEEIVLAELPRQILALNVYAPDCVPCWKEIPTLHRILDRISKDERLGLYMIVDPQLILGASEPVLPGTDDWEKARSIMLEEKMKRGIRLPILFMLPPFQVQDEGFVTGTPETILVRTKPWNIYYNFIGSISEKSTVEEIDRDPKVQFFLSMIGGRGL